MAKNSGWFSYLKWYDLIFEIRISILVLCVYLSVYNESFLKS